MPGHHRAGQHSAARQPVHDRPLPVGDGVLRGYVRPEPDLVHAGDAIRERVQRTARQVRRHQPRDGPYGRPAAGGRRWADQHLGPARRVRSRRAAQDPAPVGPTGARRAERPVRRARGRVADHAVRDGVVRHLLLRHPHGNHQHHPVHLYVVAPVHVQVLHDRENGARYYQTGESPVPAVCRIAETRD